MKYLLATSATLAHRMRGFARLAMLFICYWSAFFCVGLLNLYADFVFGVVQCPIAAIMLYFDIRRWRKYRRRARLFELFALDCKYVEAAQTDAQLQSVQDQMEARMSEIERTS